jgi:predicted phosphohydrolase
MRIVCISDTHAQHRRMTIPDGDLLLCAGDFTRSGDEADVRDFDAWLGTLPHAHKVIIAGNHDFAFERTPDAATWIRHATYLQDSGCVVGGLRIWGSPWQPRFFDWAFNLDRGAPLKAVWDLIPDDTDVLITHGPPWEVLDVTSRGQRVGCEELAKAITRVKPRLHVFGHIHESYGQVERDGVIYVNASNCDLRYRPVQAPIVVDLDPR